ncbi:MAG: thioredoxin-dependent thiol peroxidase [Cytophaga sp.]|uniref:thioredoxin-dependent thiol peroxidase n=1 Tax=Cytophaga sp. TaxID=29535 RepID=UPI003F7E0E54
MKRLLGLSILLLLAYTGSYAQSILKAGDKAPAFKAPNQNGKIVSLDDYKGHKIILYFYPKNNTPGCTTEACNLRDNSDSLASQGYIILGVSTDSISSHQKFSKQYNLPYDLLADTDATINKAYGVWILKEKNGKTFYGTARKTFVINEAGIIIRIIDAVQVDNHAAQILTE